MERLRQALRQYQFPQADTCALLAAVLSLPHPPETPPLTLSLQEQKEQTQAALVAWLCAEADQQAVTYAWEDLHWADPSSLELLTRFLDQVPTSRVLAVLTARPEFSPPWGTHSYLSQLTLSRLGRSQVETMVEKVTGGRALPTEVVQHIASKTDGVPLFVEELTKMVMESDLVTEINSHYELTGPLQPLAIPSTLQDSLMARLDRLATVREIAQLGATIGREFPYDLLQAVSPLDGETLQHGLRQLVEAEFVFQSGVPPQARYLFKHALVQDTAYQSLLKSKRRQLHHHVAQVLEQQFPQMVATQPELVAHHYTEAGSIEQALPHWQQAGELASKRLAFKEAIAHLNQGMEVLGTLPPSPERDGQELNLRTRLGGAWMSLKGWGAPEVWTNLHPALGLAKALSRQDVLFPIYWGLSENVLVQGRVDETLDWVKEMLVAAEANGTPNGLILAHHMASIVRFWRGDLAQSRVHDDRVLTLYDEEQSHPLGDMMSASDDPKGDIGLHGCLGTWMLGYPDRAAQQCEANDAYTRQHRNPFELGWVLTGAGILWDWRGDPERLLVRVEEAERLGRAHNLPWISECLAQVMKGIAWLRAGRNAEGVPQMQSAIEGFRATGGELCLPYYRAALAAGLAWSGDNESGLRLIDDCLDQIERPGWGERWYLAEVLRLKGWMLSLQGDLPGAEQNYLASLDWARQQQAKSWELRTATSLVRLWQQRGKTTEARELLAPVYNWFTEGFDTKDLQDAKALLDQL